MRIRVRDWNTRDPNVLNSLKTIAESLKFTSSPARTSPPLESAFRNCGWPPAGGSFTILTSPLSGSPSAMFSQPETRQQLIVLPARHVAPAGVRQIRLVPVPPSSLPCSPPLFTSACTPCDPNCFTDILRRYGNIQTTLT